MPAAAAATRAKNAACKTVNNMAYSTRFISAFADLFDRGEGHDLFKRYEPQIFRTVCDVQLIAHLIACVISP
jgi:hypothetical protein